jgi:hypothetical protein
MIYKKIIALVSILIFCVMFNMNYVKSEDPLCGNLYCDTNETRDNCPSDCNVRTGGTYTPKDVMIEQLKDLADANSGTYEVIGKTLLGKDIYLFQFGNPDGGKFMFDGQVHGPEDCGTETGYKFIQWVLLNDSVESNKIKNGVDLLFIPIINGDTVRRQNMRRNYTLENGSVILVPSGVDLNRNFPYRWGSSGSGSPTNTYEYRGLYGGSEPETQAVIYAQEKYRPQVYMNVHCGMQVLYHYSSKALDMKILNDAKAMALSEGTNLSKYYTFSGISAGGYVASEAYFYNASAWLFEISTWGQLPETLEQYHAKWYPKAFPVYYSMADAIANATVVETVVDDGSTTFEVFEGYKINYTMINGGFENGTSGWSVRHGYSLDVNESHSGNASIKSSSTYYNSTIDATLGDARAMWVSKVPPVQEGYKVFASVFIKTEEADCPYGLRIGIDFKMSNGSIVHAINGEWVTWGNDWTYREINGTVRVGEQKITLWLQSKPYNCSALGWFDDVRLYVMQENATSIFNDSIFNDSSDFAPNETNSDDVTSKLIQRDTFGGATTDFAVAPSLTAMQDVTLERAGYGKILYNVPITITRDLNLDDNIIIERNKISIDSLSIYEFDKPAILSLYGLTFINPRVLRDGVICTDCIELSYIDGNFEFSVTGFSNYSADETPDYNYTGYLSDYDMGDLDNIVVDGIGTAGASLVSNIDLLMTLAVLGLLVFTFSKFHVFKFCIDVIQ